MMLLLRRSCSSSRWIAKSITVRSRAPLRLIPASPHNRRVSADSTSTWVGCCAAIASCGTHSIIAASMKARMGAAANGCIAPSEQGLYLPYGITAGRP